MMRTKGSAPTGRELAAHWRTWGGDLIMAYGADYPASRYFECERETTRRQLDLACAMLDAAGEDPERAAVVLQILDIRTRGMAAGHARRFLRADCRCATEGSVSQRTGRELAAAWRSYVAVLADGCQQSVEQGTLSAADAAAFIGELRGACDLVELAGGGLEQTEVLLTVLSARACSIADGPTRSILRWLVRDEWIVD